MVFAVSTKDVSSSPIWIAGNLGHFRGEGIDARIVIMRSDLQVAGVISGDVDFAGSLSSVTKAAAVGIPIRIVVSFFNGSFFYLVAKPDIRNMEGLKGKVVAISRYGSATDFDALATLQHFGVDPSRDVKIIPVGGGGNRLASLVSQRVDAAILTINEKLQAERAGMRTLLSTGQYNRQPVGGLGASIQKIRSSRDDLVRAMRAVYRTLVVMRKDRAAVRSFFEKELAINPEQFDDTYDAVMKVFLPNGEIDAKDLSDPYEDARKAATNPPPVSLNDLVDWSILREVRSSAK
ncbi:MAG: ABC transporter substrate-binding protein [Deltaproteobacteria bacterium]|nr:ABC transporter substrate-binding protein [Deltaproteobacteria bacterium]